MQTQALCRRRWPPGSSRRRCRAPTGSWSRPWRRAGGKTRCLTVLPAGQEWLPLSWGLQQHVRVAGQAGAICAVSKLALSVGPNLCLTPISPLHTLFAAGCTPSRAAAWSTRHRRSTLPATEPACGAGRARSRGSSRHLRGLPRCSDPRALCAAAATASIDRRPGTLSVDSCLVRLCCSTCQLCKLACCPAACRQWIDDSARIIYIRSTYSQAAISNQ